MLFGMQRRMGMAAETQEKRKFGKMGHPNAYYRFQLRGDLLFGDIFETGG